MRRFGWGIFALFCCLPSVVFGQAATGAIIGAVLNGRKRRSRNVSRCGLPIAIRFPCSGTPHAASGSAEAFNMSNTPTFFQADKFVGDRQAASVRSEVELLKC